MSRRILLLITDLQIGGTPTVVRELAFRLAKEPDVYVHVACLDRWGPVADQLRDRGIPVTALNASCRFDVRVIFRLSRLICRERIDTVFSFLIHANAAAALARLGIPKPVKKIGPAPKTGTQLVFAPPPKLAASPFQRIRFLQSIQTAQPTPRWHWMLQQMIHHAARRIVVPSPSVAEAARKWAAVPPEKIEIVPNAVELAEFSLLRRNPPGNRVGFIGRLDPVKRIEDLIAAISLLKGNVSLDIFGEGPERRKIESLIDGLDLHHPVDLHGAVGGPAEALAGIDVLVLPSDAEGFGLVLIEAMAAGVPVIGTNVPGIRDVIRDGENGLLVPPRNPQALANAIEKVLSDPSLHEKLSAGGRASVQGRFTWPSVYEQYRALLV
ncbi:MAG TPA: glycosyltransferase family 4 protein [Tepidisphaeraceae bacterium]|jgi:glycosyltransferase involved in cell wall biosynthesis|nr:glycosyltransferase family 4 protein [Tepidisphaeraceae bacterium]